MGTRKGVMPGVASVVLRRGKFVHANAWGFADMEKLTPFRLDTICRIFCMTKTYVLTVFMTLVDEGKVQLEDPVSKFISSFSDLHVVGSASPQKLTKPRRTMRIRHLLNHTSGLGYCASFCVKPNGDTERSYARLMDAVDQGFVRDL